MNGIRTFAAIEFSENIKDELYKNAGLIKRLCSKCGLSLKENFHITLIFFGETEKSRINEIISIMDSNISERIINIEAGGFDRLKRDGGDVIIRKIEPADDLIDLQKTLAAAFKKRGFSFDEKPFRPHITIARRAILKVPDDLFRINRILPPLAFTAEKITLMRSDRINGKLTYTPIHTSILKR